ncbi:MAG: exosortase/archaeosortase family protein [Candidatus Omnitrophota bacterium]
MKFTAAALNQNQKLLILKASVLFALLVVTFYPIYAPLYERFTAKNSYYSHGFLIPLISAFILWRKREKFKALTVSPSSWGLGVLISGVLLHVASAALKVNFTSYLSLIIVLCGLILYLGGKSFLKEAAFGIIFLFFMIPLPEVIVIGISFKMKIMAAHLSTVFANWMGVGALREGSTIHLAKGQILIGDPCSGLRSLISFLALGVLFAYFSQASFLKRLFLVICTAPIALLSNIARIMLLVFVTHIYGEKAAMGFVHDASGIMAFVLAFLGFIAISRVLKGSDEA